jgi:hypothetical protein
MLEYGIHGIQTLFAKDGALASFDIDSIPRLLGTLGFWVSLDGDMYLGLFGIFVAFCRGVFFHYGFIVGEIESGYANARLY